MLCIEFELLYLCELVCTTLPYFVWSAHRSTAQTTHILYILDRASGDAV